MKSAANRSIRLVASAAAGLTWAGVSLAQTWNVNANGNWGTAANWSPASVPTGIGASASLLNIITAPRAVSLNVPVTLGNLTFGGNFAYTVGGTNTLTFDVAAGNAALNVSGTGSHSISRPIVLNDTLVINQGSSGILTLSGARSGTGGLIKNGTGQVTLSGVGSFTGQTRINEGTLLYNTGGAIPAASLVTIGDGIGAAGSAVLNLNAAMSAARALNVTLASDGVVVQNNNRLVRFSAVSGTGELRLNSAVGNGFEVTGTGGNSTFSGAVTGGISLNSANPTTGSRFTKTGASTLTLDGNNTYVARTFINGGSLRAASNTALGAASAGFDNATFVYNTGSLQLSNNVTLAERIYLNGTGGGSGALRNFSGNNTITGNVTLGWTATGVGSAAPSIGADAGSTLTISGNIDGAQSLTKVGAGVLVLSGNNTWSGATIVSAGTLQLGAATGMPTTVLTVNGGTFDLNGFSKTVNTLSGTGGAIALGAGALTVNQLAAGTYAGVISGTGSLAKTGAGTLTLSGANTYTGGTTVSAGTLQGNTTSLQGNIVNNAIVAFNQTAAGTYAGAMSGTGRLTKSGAGTLILTGANNYTGGTTVSAGTLQGNTTSLQGNIAASGSAVIFDQAIAGTYAGVMSGNASLTKTGAGTLTLTGANSYSGGTRLNGGTVAVASDARLGTGGLTFNGGALQTLAALTSAKAVSLLGAGTIDTNGFTSTFSGAITGAGSLVKTGAGTLTLTGNNTFSGGSTVTAGTLQGNTTSLRNAIVNNAAVTFNQTAAGTYAGVMSGTGALTKIGAGTLTLSGANTYSGGTSVNAGILSGNSSSLQGNIVNSATVNFNQAAAGTYAGSMSGTGVLTKSGAGTLILTGANTYAGGTTVSAGTLQGNTNSLQGNIVANNSAVTFDQAATGTYAGAMSGNASLTKMGAGTLTLTGANSYTGGTRFNGGSIAVASDAQLGTGALTFNGGALQTLAAFSSTKAVSLLGVGTIDTNGFAANLSGAITGVGSLVKNGAGTLTVNGANTYSGGTTVNSGTLQGNTTSLQGTIVNNGAVVFDQAATGTYAGVMSGTGSLTKNNTGTLILSGANTYAGGTAVNAGTLQGDSTSLQGNIANNAAVAFDQAGTGTYTGVMSGSGSLTKNNVGTLILTASNTYSGGTTVNGGTLHGNTASLQGNIVNNASVVLDQNTDGAYAAAMSGTGALTKLGSGNLTIGGVNTFSGPTAVNAGTLTVLGSMTSNLALAAGATLTGNGIVGGINATAGSIVAPGGAQSTLTANGAYTHSDGAIFRVHADATGASSRLNVNGAATLEGGTVDVQAQDGYYAPATRYAILNASAGVDGMFSSVTSNLAFLTPTLEYDPTNVFLTLARNDTGFAEVASTANQRQVSNAFDRATAANATGDIATVIDAVTALSAPQARSAYESMGGLVHTLLPTIGISDVNHFNRATASRLRARTEGAAGTGLAWSGVKLASVQSPHSDAPALFASTGGTRGSSDAASGDVWLSGYGLDGDLDGDTSSGKYDYRISGLIIGIDTDIDRNWTGGLSAAYSDWRVRNDGRGDRSDAKAYRIGGYGRFSDGPIRVDGVVGYGNVDYETDRRIVFGTINRTAHADYSGEQFTANLVGRYRIEHGHYGIEPFAAVQYVLESQDGFVEAGADSVNLSVASRTLKSTRGTLGVRVDRAFDTAGGIGLVEIRAGYSREFSGVPNISANFIGDPTQTGLGIFAENFDRGSWLAGAGVSFAPRKNMTLYVDVNGDFQSQGTLVSVMGGLRLSW